MGDCFSCCSSSDGVETSLPDAKVGTIILLNADCIIELFLIRTFNFKSTEVKFNIVYLVNRSYAIHMINDYQIKVQV